MNVDSLLEVQSVNTLAALKPVEALSVNTKDSSKPITMHFKQDTNTWRILLQELIGGKVSVFVKLKFISFSGL